jgi:hypothetical protein
MFRGRYYQALKYDMSNPKTDIGTGNATVE